MNPVPGPSRPSGPNTARRDSEISSKIDNKGVFRSSSHGGRLLSKIKNLHASDSKDFMCDVTLKVGDETFNCHRILLALNCEYFETMFYTGLNEEYKNEFEIKEVDPSFFKFIIEFIYTGEVNFANCDVEELLTLADYFRISELQEACEFYLRSTVDCNNCISRLLFANLYQRQLLKRTALNHICANFGSIKDDRSMFSDVPGDLIVELLKSSILASNEEDVYKFADQWLESNVKEKASYRQKLLNCVRYPFISPNFLYDVVATSSHFYESEELKGLINLVLSAVCFPSRRSLLPAHMTSPRKSSEFTEKALLLNQNGFVSVDHDLKLMAHHLTFAPQRACPNGENIYFSTEGLGHTEFRRYNMRLNTIARLQDIPGQFSSTFAVVDDKIYSFGGYSSERDTLRHVLDRICEDKICEYNIIEELWKVSPVRLPMPCQPGSAVTCGKSVYLFGGTLKDGNSSTDIIHFDSATNTCRVLETRLIEKGETMSTPSINGVIYIINGEHFYGFHHATETLTVLPRLEACRDKKPMITVLSGNVVVFVQSNNESYLYMPSTGKWRAMRTSGTFSNITSAVNVVYKTQANRFGANSVPPRLFGPPGLMLPLPPPRPSRP